MERVAWTHTQQTGPAPEVLFRQTVGKVEQEVVVTAHTPEEAVRIIRDLLRLEDAPPTP